MDDSVGVASCYGYTLDGDNIFPDPTDRIYHQPNTRRRLSRWSRWSRQRRRKGRRRHPDHDESRDCGASGRCRNDHPRCADILPTKTPPTETTQERPVLAVSNGNEPGTRQLPPAISGSLDPYAAASGEFGGVCSGVHPAPAGATDWEPRDPNSRARAEGHVVGIRTGPESVHRT
ncbi:predicted protein [Aspergillus terreus NIH2624]|uniref:Uncharacterized protein n=1 Tax=Aspergillus terreus (strain NIH 2624 / FGSC A1156) TaxID=341663 RepID=Q0CMF6_ASPTN|nr:uncharacterized protein ATEG_05128 [Aspergillus terreus NIH2624]EAU34197.1 predicted protein [Aspergillus terreus NIH2624]